MRNRIFFACALIALPQVASTQSLITQDAQDCHIAINTTWQHYDKTKGDQKAWRRYWDGMNKLGQVTGVYTYNSDMLPDYIERKKAMVALLPQPKMQKLADKCIAALGKNNGKSINPYAGQLDTPEFLAARAKRQSDAQIASRAQKSSQASAHPTYTPAPVDPKEAQCRSIMDEGVASATNDMKDARKWVESWIKMGASGSAMGGDYVQSGCSTINSTINRLKGAQCHSDYSNAMTKFRNDYYIDLPNGGAFQCS